MPMLEIIELAPQGSHPGRLPRLVLRHVGISTFVEEEEMVAGRPVGYDDPLVHTSSPDSQV